MLLRRMIGQDQSEIEPTQRENIFQSRCKINKWVCSLIIDGGSSTNVDEGLTPTKDEGKCLRRLSMFRKEVH